MTDKETNDGPGISRRKLLGSLAAVGSLGAFTGAATEANILDVESFPDNLFNAGYLDIRLGWWERKDNAGDWESYPSSLPDDPEPGSQVKRDQLTDSPGPTIKFDDVEPGDSGRVVIPFHACNNPAWIWLKIKSYDYLENGKTWKEIIHGDSSGDKGELQDFLQTRVWYDSNCNGEFEEGETLITERLDDVVLLDGKEKTIGETECEFLGKADYEEGHFEVEEDGHVEDNDGNPVLRFDADGVEVTITITNKHIKHEDGESELIGLDFESSHELCKAVVKGGRNSAYNQNINHDKNHEHRGNNGGGRGSGPGEVKYDLNCRTQGTLMAPRKDEETLFGLSNVEFYLPKNCEDRDCFDFECPDGDARCISFEWKLPKEESKWLNFFGDGNSVDTVRTDSMKLDLKFEAQQCRHNEEPQNPWQESGGDE